MKSIKSTISVTSVKSVIPTRSRRGWNGTVLSVMNLLALAACASDDEIKDADDGESSAVAAVLSPNPCTEVKLTAPAQNFTGTVGVPIFFTAAATCPAEQIPEYQYWQKLYGAPNWTHLSSYYVPGSWGWTPPSAAAWCVTVVARATGAPENYQTRASAKCGTIATGNHPPIAIDDTLSTTKNAIGAVNVLVNDSDPDGDAISVTTFTQPTHGVSNVSSSGVAFYLPAPNYVGSDSFTYTIADPFSLTDTGSVNVTVAP